MLPEHTVITAYGPENSSGTQCAVDPLLLALGWGGGGRWLRITGPRSVSSQVLKRLSRLESESAI